MRNESGSNGGSAERASGLEASSAAGCQSARSAQVELRTGCAPPFRAMLSRPASPPSNEPIVFPESWDFTLDNNEAGVELPVVPGYEIIRELGRGGMGIVYLARQSSLNRYVALKMILSGPHASPSERARFRTEAKAAAQLQHPNIVQVYEVGEQDGKPFLSLEYVDGGSLAQKAAGMPQAGRQAALAVELLARAVHYTHQRGILHRDLKPTNVLLARREAGDRVPFLVGTDGSGHYEPKITDFGLAKFVDQGGRTRTETLIGTPNYMPPEQAAGDTKKIGVPADVYSLGAILYELLTGRPPFCGTEALDTLEQVRTKDPVPPRRLRAEVARDLEIICLRCLEKEPDNRYPSALALALDLRRFLNGESIQARPASLLQRWWRSARRSPVLVAKVVSAVALICVLLACGWYFCVAGQVTAHRADLKYRKFLQHRNDALFYGLLAPEQQTLFGDSQATADTKAGESAAREALALAGVKPGGQSPTVDLSFSAQRRSSLKEDCYTLLLMLAGFRSQPPFHQQESKERCQEALQLLDTARKLGLESRAYYLRRADVLDQARKHDEARRERDQARSTPLNGTLDYFLIGEQRYRRGDWDGAKQAFDRVLALNPSHFWAQFLQSVCHLKLQQWEAAKAGLNACRVQQPDFIWIYLYRSFANEKLEAFQEAETDFEQALRLNPNDDAHYFLLLARGILHFNQGARGSAAEDFRRARALKPNQYHAYLNLAHTYLALGEFEQAADQARKGLQLQPPPEAVYGYYVERGRNLLRAKRYAEAIQACDTAGDFAPDRPAASAVRGQALLALGYYEQAEQSFDRYLQNGGEGLPDIFVGRGTARMRLANYPEAAEDYTRALERTPNAQLYQHRGWAHFFSDAWKLALRDFSKAIELDPGASDAYTGRGLALVMLGDYRAAVADAEEALRRKITAPEMMHNIACIFAQAVAQADANQEQDPQAPVEDYRRRALDAVRRTLRMLDPNMRLSFWRDKIVPDAALAPIRNDARFQRLQEEYVPPSPSSMTR
jgi:serine/threonine protein kinase/tetratricopeptide (TPR) repeat protein